jgi:hypothetical protein
MSYGAGGAFMSYHKLKYVSKTGIDEVAEYHLFTNALGDSYEVQIAEQDAFVKDNWNEFGLVPYFIAGWYCLGWELSDIDSMLRWYVGKGYDSCNVTFWIERMESNGISFPDGESVFEIMGKLIYDLILEDEKNRKAQ